MVGEIIGEETENIFESVPLQTDTTDATQVAQILPGQSIGQEPSIADNKDDETIAIERGSQDLFELQRGSLVLGPPRPASSEVQVWRPTAHSSHSRRISETTLVNSEGWIPSSSVLFSEVGKQAIRESFGLLPHFCLHKIQPKQLEISTFSDFSGLQEDHVENQSRKQPVTSKAWRLVCDMKDQLYESTLTDLREDHEAELRTLKEEQEERLKAADSRKTFLQKQVRKLMEYRNGLQHELKAKDELARSVTTSVESLQQENARLRDLVLSLRSREDSDEVAALKVSVAEKEMTLFNAFTHEKSLEARLATAQQTIDKLNKCYYKSYKFGEYYFERAQDLNYARDGTTHQSAELERAVKYSEKMYHDLEKRSGDCFAELGRVERLRDLEQAAAEAEINSLKQACAKHHQTIMSLEDSKRASENESAKMGMLLNERLTDTAIRDATSEVLKTMLVDGQILKQSIEIQDQQILNKNNQILALQSGKRALEGDLEMSAEALNELQNEIRTYKTRVESLEIEQDIMSGEHQETLQLKESEIINLTATIDTCRRNVEELAQLDQEAKTQWLIGSKNQAIEALQRKNKALEDSNHKLLTKVDDFESKEEFNVTAASMYDAHHGDLCDRLEAAEREVAELREELKVRDRAPTPLELSQIKHKAALDHAIALVREHETEIDTLRENMAVELQNHRQSEDVLQMRFEALKDMGRVMFHRMVRHELTLRSLNVEDIEDTGEDPETVLVGCAKLFGLRFEGGELFEDELDTAMKEAVEQKIKKDPLEDDFIEAKENEAEDDEAQKYEAEEY